MTNASTTSCNCKTCSHHGCACSNKTQAQAGECCCGAECACGPACACSATCDCTEGR